MPPCECGHGERSHLGEEFAFRWCGAHGCTCQEYRPVRTPREAIDVFFENLIHAAAMSARLDPRPEVREPARVYFEARREEQQRKAAEVSARLDDVLRQIGQEPPA